MLKSREQIIQEKLGSVNESVFKIGDIYKVKTVIEVPKSLINAFVSKSKKEHDVDPRESWSDMDLAELFVNYVNSNFMNIDSIPVDAIMGEKDNRAKSDSSVIVTDTTTEEPLQQTADVTSTTTSTETPIENQEEPKTQEETRIANIPTELQVESKVNESSHTDFIMNYSDELKYAVEQMLSIQSVEIEDEKKLKELEKKAAPIMARYDKNVENFIFNGDASVDGIVNIGFDNYYRYGTEPQFIIDAIDSMYHMYVRLGLLKYKQTDEKMETFMINAALTDVLKDHLNENHIEYDQSAGILEITTTKSKLKKIKEIL